MLFILFLLLALGSMFAGPRLKIVCTIILAVYCLGVFLVTGSILNLAAAFIWLCCLDAHLERLDRS